MHSLLKGVRYFKGLGHDSIRQSRRFYFQSAFFNLNLFEAKRSFYFQHKPVSYNQFVHIYVHEISKIAFYVHVIAGGWVLLVFLAIILCSMKLESYVH